MSDADCKAVFTPLLRPSETLIWCRATHPNVRRFNRSLAICVAASAVIGGYWYAYPTALDYCTGYAVRRCGSFYLIPFLIAVVLSWHFCLRVVEALLARKGTVHVYIALTNERVMRTSDFVLYTLFGLQLNTFDYFKYPPRLKRKGLLFFGRNGVASVSASHAQELCKRIRELRS